MIRHVLRGVCVSLLVTAIAFFVVGVWLSRYEFTFVASMLSFTCFGISRMFLWGAEVKE